MEFTLFLFLMVLVGGSLMAGSVIGYIWIFRRVYLLHEGKVVVNRFTRIDAILACLLVIGIIHICFNDGIGFRRSIDPRAIDTDQLIVGVLSQWFIIIGTIVVLFLVRGMKPTALFGFDRLRTWQVIAFAVGLLLAALPLVFVTSYLISAILRVDPQRDSQEIVQIFQGITDPVKKFPIVILAVVVAPLAEEFVFRGFLYGVLKRYFGALPSLLFTGILFALIHLHLPSLLPLFVLACTLTLAYEFSGTLLVPMGMHSLFNTLSLLVVSFSRQ